MSNIKIADQLSTLATRNDLPDDVLKTLTDATIELRSPIETDLWIYRWVVIVLGVIALITVLGGLMLPILTGDKSMTIPDAIVALGSAALGALAGLLAPSPKR